MEWYVLSTFVVERVCQRLGHSSEYFLAFPAMSSKEYNIFPCLTYCGEIYVDSMLVFWPLHLEKRLLNVYVMENAAKGNRIPFICTHPSLPPPPPLFIDGWTSFWLTSTYSTY